MSKLVDKEKLAKLAQGLDARMKAAVKAEEERALAAEQAIDAKADANAAAIAAINNADTGILKQAKTYADGEVNKEKERAVAKESELAGKISTLEGIVGSENAGAFGEVKQAVADNTAAIAKLNGGADVEGSVAKAVKAETDRAELAEQGLSQRIATAEAFVAAQPAKDKAQDDRLAVIEEMMGLGGVEGDKTALQELQESINAVEDKADQAQTEVDAVEVRMTTAETDITQLKADVAKLDGDEDTEGSVKKQIADAIATVDQAAEALEGRVAANEAFVAGYSAKETKIREDFAAADNTLHTTITAEISAAVNTEADRAKGVEGDLDAAIKAEAQAARAAEKGLADRLDVIEGEGEGSVKKALADAKSYTDGKVEAVNDAAELLEARVKANEDALAIVNGANTVEGSIAKAEKDAKDYADQKITALVDSAPDAMNTLNELAQAIKAHGNEYTAYVATVSQNIATAKSEAIAQAKSDAAAADATLKTELQKEIDDDVKVEKERAVAEEANIRTEFAAADAALKAELQKEIDDDVKAVVDAQKLVNDAQARTNKDFEDRIAANEVFVAAQPAIDQEQDRRIKALEDANKDGGAMKEAVDAAQKAADDAQTAAEAADAKAVAAQADVNAVKERLDKEGGLVDRLEAAETFVKNHSHEALQGEIDAVEGRCDALEAFVEAHDHSVMEKGIADNKAAIEKEVKDRNDAIAAALEAYSTTEEMKGVIGNVVNSLALTMENNKVILKLGGVDGIALTSVDLDLATDDDITAIINGLDA